MNIDNMRKLRDCIADKANYFNMSDFSTLGIPGEECGSPSCVIGWANYLEHKENPSNFDSSYLGEQKWLEITDKENVFIYRGDFRPSLRLEDITREETIKFLNHCIAVGHIDMEYDR